MVASSYWARMCRPSRGQTFTCSVYGSVISSAIAPSGSGLVFKCVKHRAEPAHPPPASFADHPDLLLAVRGEQGTTVDIDRHVLNLAHFMGQPEATARRGVEGVGGRVAWPDLQDADERLLFSIQVPVIRGAEI